MPNFPWPKLNAGVKRKRTVSASPSEIDALYEHEKRTNLAALALRRRKARSLRSALEWVEYWPVAVGVLLSCFAPQLRETVELAKPWGMWVVFPFVAMFERPEMAFSREFTSIAPLIALYAQFPLEGLLARFALRGNVSVQRVLGQTFFLHLLGAVEMWLINGPWGGK
jgi:hypothetical protein